MTNITIDDRGIIQSIKFGILAKHTWVPDIFLWLVLPSKNLIFCAGDVDICIRQFFYCGFANEV
jgi:hypothetical protein